MNSESNYQNALDNFIKHQSQIPVIAEYYFEFARIAGDIDVSTNNNIKYTTQRVQYNYYLERISELNFSLQNSLTLGKYATVEALSRVALESSVNLMYLLGEKENERAMGLLTGHIRKNLYKAKKWNEHSVTQKNEIGIKQSEKLIQAMEDGQKRLMPPSGCEPKESANKQVISSQAGSLIKISRIRADCSPVNTSN
ncbi:hypothetical protein [Aeromonas salmonicida]|uniref:hypothetical protein n=1 Tax=Aeromonas salmonicida TaxID=645 RepID=UPI0038D0F9DD